MTQRGVENRVVVLHPVVVHGREQEPGRQRTPEGRPQAAARKRHETKKSVAGRGGGAGGRSAGGGIRSERAKGARSVLVGGHGPAFSLSPRHRRCGGGCAEG